MIDDKVDKTIQWNILVTSYTLSRVQTQFIFQTTNLVKTDEMLWRKSMAECLSIELEPQCTSMFLAYNLFVYILTFWFIMKSPVALAASSSCLHSADKKHLDYSDTEVWIWWLWDKIWWSLRSLF